MFHDNLFKTNNSLIFSIEKFLYYFDRTFLKEPRLERSFACQYVDYWQIMQDGKVFFMFGEPLDVHGLFCGVFLSSAVLSSIREFQKRRRNTLFPTSMKVTLKMMGQMVNYQSHHTRKSSPPFQYLQPLLQPCAKITVSTLY